MLSYMLLPDYYPDLVELIRSAGWLMHNFSAPDVDIYNAVDFQQNRQIEGVKYQVILDMNIMQYLLDVVRKPSSTKLSKIASAYLAFFQIADIQLDPTYATYEKISYCDDRADEAISNLEQFRGIDNYDLDGLAGYALGYAQQLKVAPKVSENREELKGRLLQYRRLTDWDSLYLCILSITNIAMDPSIPRSQKLCVFAEWCAREFRFSLPALVYAAVLFGRAPAKKMMKYKVSEKRQAKRSSLYNMTWDFYYFDRYMKSWVSKNESTEILLLTADGALRLTMQLAVKCQLAGGLDPLRFHVGDQIQEIDKIYACRNAAKRAYKSKEWNYNYREKLISEYEVKLL